MREFKPLFLFIARFFITYVALSFSYQAYLRFFSVKGCADPYTSLNAKVGTIGLNLAGVNAKTIHYGNEVFERITIDNQYVSIVNEGCNGMSIIIIFIAFLFSFYTKFKQTVLYGLFGVLLIIFSNVFRIALLTYIFKYFSQYAKTGHDYLFPLIIYGTVVLLWFFWIKFYFSKYTRKNAK